MTCSVSVVLPEDSGRSLYPRLPRGSPPTPEREIEAQRPVDTTSMSLIGLGVHLHDRALAELLLDLRQGGG